MTMLLFPTPTIWDHGTSRKVRRPPGFGLALLASTMAVTLAGCASTVGGGATEAAYAAMDCNALNRSMTGVSAEVSRTAVTRGDVTRWDGLRWVPGRARVTSTVDERLTKRIERLQDEERAIAAARARNCPRQAD